ncbi:MAG: xanthine dehydrogenase family protein molybdopterin-binding subunit [Nitrososphaeria archaeon]
MQEVLLDEEKYVEYMIDRWLKATDLVVVGKSVTRIDSLEKVLGRARYVEDYLLAGTVYARLIKSSIPAGSVRRIDASGLKGVEGVLGIVTADDVPGVNQVGYFIKDQPLFARDEISFIGEPLGLVVARSLVKADEARELVRVEYEERRPVFDPLEAMKDGSPLVHSRSGSNIAIRTRARKGNVEEGFSKSDVIVEREYRLQHQDHAYIEPEIALVVPDGDSYQVIVSGQYPHLVQRTVAGVLGTDESKVEVINPYVGGGFGGKDDIGPVIAAEAAVAAYKFRRPVLLLYTREDSFTSHNKRESAIVRYRTGATKEGKLMAVEATIIFDTGAYANRGPFTLWRSTVHATGPYEIPNVKVDGYLVYTNKVYSGSFRGFGNTASQLAAEMNLNILADKLNIDPIDLRLKNILRKGSTTGTGHVITEDVGLAEALMKIREASGWDRKRRERQTESDGKVRGIGVACAWHGMGTSRAAPQYSAGYVVMRKDGSVDVYTGITEIGQGTATGIAQIVSEVLGVQIGRINVHAGTTEAPDTGATHSSRGSNLGSMGVYVAAIKLRWRIARYAADVLGCSALELDFRNDEIICTRNGRSVSIRDLARSALEKGYELSATGYYAFPRGEFDEEKGQGFMYVMFSYIALITEVEVDKETGVVKVKKVWPGLAAGRIINPLLAREQLEGAFIQGMGFTLTEELVINDGKIMNPSLADYLVPTTKDVEDLEFGEPVFASDFSRYGPFGAKGIGEMALIPVPASILSAIYSATGVEINRVPATPEVVYRAIRGGEV